MAFGCTTDLQSPGALVAWLQPLSPSLIALDASNIHDDVVAAVQAEAALPVVIVNLHQVQKFAGAIGLLAKTDAFHAAVIAHFAAVRPTAGP